MAEQSESNMMKELAPSPDDRHAAHLSNGLSTLRPGAGVAVVGDQKAGAATLQEFVNVGRSESTCPVIRTTSTPGASVPE